MEITAAWLPATSGTCIWNTKSSFNTRITALHQRHFLILFEMTLSGLYNKFSFINLVPPPPKKISVFQSKITTLTGCSPSGTKCPLKPALKKMYSNMLVVQINFNHWWFGCSWKCPAHSESFNYNNTFTAKMLNTRTSLTTQQSFFITTNCL